jgi:hypothetical protein
MDGVPVSIEMGAFQSVKTTGSRGFCECSGLVEAYSGKDEVMVNDMATFHQPTNR